MADDNNQTQTTVAGQGNDEEELLIPPETQGQFPDLIELIKKSQSMNNEERQYWVDVLPIMTEDQLKNLRSILDNEKKQIEEASADFSKGSQSDLRVFNIQFDEAKYREKKRMRLMAEKKQEEEERGQEDKILEEIETLKV